MTALSLPAIRELLEVVTPGPWKIDEHDPTSMESIVSIADNRPWGWVEVARSLGPDAAFIAAAPSIVAQLVGVVERVEGLAKYLDRLAPGDQHYAGLIRAAVADATGGER